MIQTCYDHKHVRYITPCIESDVISPLHGHMLKETAVKNIITKF